jgi:hypothetical protein
MDSQVMTVGAPDRGHFLRSVAPAEGESHRSEKESDLPNSAWSEPHLNSAGPTAGGASANEEMVRLNLVVEKVSECRVLN